MNCTFSDFLLLVDLLTSVGYKVDVFGIENEVMLDEPISIKVAPSLPLINLHCTLDAATPDYSTNPDDEDYQTLFASLSTYRGHR